MPGVDFSKELLGAGASAKTDFAAAQARTGLTFTGAANFKRGVKAELGIEAFANASAELSKFVHASIKGTAFARAKAGVQLQLPLNLFTEFGFSARAEAIAEAAAGVEANLGLSIGDFILLAKRDQNLIGLPLEILLLFLEEVSIGGAFEVNVSASAKAHASVSVSGTIIEKAGDKAGFYFTVDAGVGLAAGVGMGLRAGAEFKDFRRFYGRAVDRTVDTTIQEIIRLLPSDLTIPLTQEPLAPVFEAFSPVAKIALRVAYDIGLKIAENNPGNSANDMTVLCDEALKTFLEESQRFIFTKLLENGLNEIRKLLEQSIPNLNAGSWDHALPKRIALATILLAMPAEPFQAKQENLDYWKDLITKATNLIAEIGNPDPKLTEAISIIYCTYELMMEAVRSKVNQATAYATAIGAGRVSADPQPFKANLQNQPPAPIRDCINGIINRNNQQLTYADLLQCLVDYTVSNSLLASLPELNQFITIFKSKFQQSENRILTLFLQNARSFDLSGANPNSVDSTQLLQLIVDSISIYLTDIFKTKVLPQILEHVDDPNLRLYIQEVLYEAVLYMKDVGLGSILKWKDKTFTNEDFTESLAGVLMLLLGRTVVIVGDTLLTAAQESIERECKIVAGKIRDAVDNPHNNHDDIADVLLHANSDLLKLTADCIEIGGKILGPLPDDTRSRVRHLLYQVFEPIPVGREQTFLESLGDQFFIPNKDQLQQLTDELTYISKERFVEFVEKFILRIGDYILEKLEELILFVIDLVVNWEKHLAEALLAIADFLKNLEKTIHDINVQLINLMSAATEALHDLLSQLSSSTLRTRIKNDIKDKFVDKAFDALEDNDIYKMLPSGFKSTARSLVNGSVDAVMNNPLINPVFDAIAAVANQLDELIPDVRELDPDDNLPEQVFLLILDKIEDNIRTHFDGGKPHISPSLDVTYKTWEYYDWDWHLVTHHIHIPLGRIEINMSSFIDLVRDAINALSFYHTKLNDACFKLGKALAKELELNANYTLQKEKQLEQGTLAQINKEHNNDPKEILILSPTTLAHYTNSLDVKIHLGGVTMSYLGLNKDESQRVLIYINGNLIPPKSLVAEDLPKNVSNHSEDYDFTKLYTKDKVSGRITNSFDRTTGVIKSHRATIFTDTRIQFKNHALNMALVNTGTAYSFSGAALKETVTSKALYKTPAKDKAPTPFAGKTVKSDTKGRTVTSHSIVNNLPGRKLPPAALNKLVENSIAGIMIRFSLNLNDPVLTEGVNVLTVVVIEKGGSRHQKNVSFTISLPTLTNKPVPGVIRVADSKTGKIVNSTITLSSVFNKYVLENKKDKKNVPTLSAKNALTNFISSDNSQNLKLNKAKVTAFIPKSKEPIIKKEIINVRDNSNNIVDKKTISYTSIIQREKALKDLGFTSKQLARKKLKLSSEKITYEEKLNLYDIAANSITTIIHEHAPSAIRKEVYKELNGDAGKSNRKFKPSAIQNKAIRINTLLPVTLNALSERNILAKNYLEMQDGLNFKAIKLKK